MRTKMCDHDRAFHNIKFTQLFNDVFENKFKISKKLVQQALSDPSAQEIIKLDDLELIFFIKTENILDTCLLVCARKDNMNWLIDVAFIIPPNMVDMSHPLEPIIVLQQFVQRFGLEIRLGQHLNKFIFRELLHIDQKSNDISKLIEIKNPSNHKCIQQLYIKLEPCGDKKIINCALAYCIDEDEYSSWLFGISRTIDEVIVQIAPHMRGMITPRDLINANGTLEFSCSYSEIGVGKAGFLFRLTNEFYYFEVGFTESTFYIARNKDRLDLPFQPAPTGWFMGCAIWSPTELRLLILDGPYNNSISMLARPIEEELKRREKVFQTSATIPPNSLVSWARNNSIVPAKTYESIKDFNEVVASAIQYVQDLVSDLGFNNPFWDISYDGSKIVSKKPKRETDIQPTIHALLYSISLAKTLEISREHTIGGGKLDFLISGRLSSGKVVRVCIEFKHAHSKDILNGLLKQLPAYMQAEGCDFGIYCVMYFKGNDFFEPKEYDLQQLDTLLSTNSISAGLSNIRIIFLDLSHKKPPSKL